MSRREPFAVLASVAIIIWAIAILLSVAVGTFVLLASDEDVPSYTGPAVERPADAGGPNWAEQMTAIGTVALAIATVALAYFAYRALGGLRESRQDRNLAAMMDMSRRWDDEHFREVRRKIQAYADHGPSSRITLRDKILELRVDNDPEYRELLTEPSFLEDLSILVDNEGIDFDIVMASLGYIVWDRWCLWQPTIEELRAVRNEESVFENFQKLAYRVKGVAPQLPDVDAWDGPRY
ncbi:hypothetical protein A5739_11390 [Mycobacterium colombiense]|uniref:DUF4760 domain-containing protein n=1 Tax=Mycobacterium colombiense TaxID=339268 RepID=UPI00096DD967|nr:DUF4760 domain-containing protein [Mycobacterium colombiense]OMC32016.1 hypothetical protein A5739_11390 [Mycobacterium colombiense]